MRISVSSPVAVPGEPAEIALDTLTTAIADAQDLPTDCVRPVDYVESVHLVSIGAFRGLTVVVADTQGAFTRGALDVVFAQMAKDLGIALPVLVEQAR